MKKSDYFAINVKKLRNSMGLSQIELAGNAGIGQQTVVRAEKGTIPRGANIAKLAEALGVSERDLFSDPFATKNAPEIVENPMAPVMEELHAIRAQLDQKSGPSLSPEQEKLVRLIRGLNDKQTARAIRLITTMLSKPALDEVQLKRSVDGYASFSPIKITKAFLT